MQDDESKVFHLGLLKLALLRFEIELVLAELFQNQAYNVAVLLLGLGEDENVIKVYAYHSFSNEVPEDVIHHGLECSWAIGEAKEHDQWFKQPLICLECCLPLISFLNVHIVIAPVDI